MRKALHLCLFLFPFIFINIQAFSQALDNQLFTIFLIGDAGEPNLNGLDKNLQLLQQQLESNPASAVVFLGDNIYYNGMPDVGHKDRFDAENRIKAQMDILKKYQGKIFFISGNHDWKRGKTGGWRYVQNQEKFVEEYLQKGNVFLPDNGCPDPIETQLADNLILIVLDTQWWLQPKEDRPNEESDCACQSEAEVIQHLQNILAKNPSKQIVVAAHHPMYTYGEHNGTASWKDHIFPLTKVNKNLYIPLPVLGSLMPLYRKFIGNIQDNRHFRFRLMQKSITQVLQKYPNTIYVNGHDHSLQYILRDSLHFITSGSGSKTSVVRKGRFAQFAESQKGFARLDFYTDTKVRLTFWEAEKPTQVAYNQWIIENKNIPKNQIDSTHILPNDLGKSVLVSASDIYRAGVIKQALLGKNYRKEWQTKLEVPVFDIDKEQGGLKILQKGGGMQTKSLRLQAPDGQEFVLRSIEKNPETALPEVIQKTAFADLVQDQISAAHPYSALAVPLLAEAARVPHANPKVVFVPDDPRLGEYRSFYANTLALFEERNPATKPDQKSYSTDKIIEKLQEDNDNQVNQKNVLKARLFDMYIGDWDRHDDQWRWWSEKTNKGAIFNPIPRDRDQVFFINEGILPKIVSRKWALPKIQGFDKTIRDIRTFNFNARYFDRSFLTELSRKDWLNAAEELKNQMTDTVIEQAVRQLPSEIFKLRGLEIIEKLKARRSILSQEAEKYYRFLAKQVSITGSDKNELFLMESIDNQQVIIKIFKISKSGDTSNILYQRTFFFPETKEIRLYGLSGEDVFSFKGSTKTKIKIRIIAGEGQDKIIQKTSTNKPWVYDTKNSVKIEGNIKNRTSQEPEVNLYNRKDFKYNLLMPLLSLQYNVDDGVFLGGGVLLKLNGFRKEPFASQHKLTANHAYATRSYNFDYQGIFTDIFKKTDLEVNLEVKAPNFVNNFFGLGNERVSRVKELGINYYRVRFENVQFNLLLGRKMSKSIRLNYGLNFESIEVEENPERFISQFTENGLNSSIFERKNYAGLMGGLSIDTRNNKAMPESGVFWQTEAKWMRGLGESTRNYAQIRSDLAFYWTFKLPARLVFATRFGGGINLSNYEFFQANTLGGLTNMRGYRRTRFSGGDSFYNNTEIRLRLFSLRTYLFPAYVGILGFHDIGRVWEKNEKSRTWHRSFGGGVWIAPFQQLVISAVYGFTKEENLPLIKLGFLF